MATILTPENFTLEPQGAAKGYSFFYKAAEQAFNSNPYDFATNFFIRFGDVLAEDVGVVLQAGIETNGTLVDIKDTAKVNNLTLVFDARRRENCEYTWQLAVADTNGREVHQLHITPGGCRATYLSFDAQGRLQAADEGHDRAELAEKIQSLALHNRLRSEAKELRRARAKMERELEDFSVKGILGLDPTFYDREIARKQRMLDILGFTALKPLAT